MYYNTYTKDLMLHYTILNEKAMIKHFVHKIIVSTAQ